MAAFERVRGWLDAGEVPVDASAGGLPEVYVACVTLWSGGRPVGVGTAAGVEPDAARIVTAAREAFVRARLSGGGVLPDREQLTLSVELSHRLVPAQGGSLEELSVSFSPGMDGLCVTLGTRAEAVTPLMLLARSSGPATSLNRLVSDLRDGDPVDAFNTPNVLRARGYQLYRFRVSHLAERAPGLGVRYAHRGGRVVSGEELDVTGLREFAGGLADHLMARRWPGAEPFGMVGTPNASNGASAPVVAPASEQIMTALALARLAGARGIPDTWSEELLAYVSRLLGDLADVAPGERDPVADIPAVCLLVALRAQLAETGAGAAVADEHGGLLGRAAERLVAYALPEAPDADVVIEPEHASLVAWALASESARLDAMLESADDPEHVEAEVARFNRGARKTINAVLRSVPISSVAGEMPWLGWAAMALPRSGVADTADFLRKARDAALTSQIRRADVPPDERDLVGGIVFTTGTTPLPTAQSARVAALCAAMLRHEALTGGSPSEGEFPRHLVRTLETIRFLRQLAADDTTAYLHARPARARWGVRSALWDQRQPAQASALTLIALCDALDAMDERSE